MILNRSVKMQQGDYIMSRTVFNVEQTSDYLVKSGKEKINKNIITLILQGFIAGLCIAFGAIGYYKIASLALDPGVGAFFAAAIFPIGIIAVMMLGAELFTSDTMVMMGVYNKKYSLLQALKVLIIVWIANLVGMFFISGLTSLSGIFTEEMMHKINHVAQVKTTMPFSQMIFSAILCNIIVCLGVWMAYAIQKLTAKIIVLWFMITVFVLSGTEHIIANMFYLFTAYFLGADISLGGIAYNFLWVTIGNFIGGGVIVVGVHKLMLSRLEKK